MGGQVLGRDVVEGGQGTVRGHLLVHLMLRSECIARLQIDLTYERAAAACEQPEEGGAWKTGCGRGEDEETRCQYG